MKRYFRIAATILLLLTMVATVAGCIHVCTPAPGTDTGDIGWKLGVTYLPMLAAIALVWAASLYGCILYFLWDRKKWNIALTIFMVLVLLFLILAPVLILWKPHLQPSL